MKCTGKKIGNRDEKTDQKNGRNRKQKTAGCNAVEEGKKKKSNWGAGNTRRAGRATLGGKGEDHEGQAEQKRGTRRKRRASGNIMKTSRNA